MHAITITLGGTEYRVRPFTIAQHRKLAAAEARRVQALPPLDGAGRLAAAATREQLAAFMTAQNEYDCDLVMVALERADPQPLKGAEIEATADEIAMARAAILAGNREAVDAAGGAPAPGEGPAPAAATAGATSSAS